MLFAKKHATLMVMCGMLFAKKHATLMVMRSLLYEDCLVQQACS
jgi:hypothetical protein